MGRNEKGQFTKGSGIVDLTGKRFGRLTVISLDRITNGRTYWNVRCDCGNVKSVRADTLKVITSCGCRKKEQDIFNLGIKYNHKMTYHHAYNVWWNMMNRCFSEKSTFYNDYGGRGITVCEEWKDVKNFCKWTDESGYKKGLTLDRIDVNGNYEPSNCRWITIKEQQRNKRNTFYCYVDGEKISAAKLSSDYGIPLKTIKDRYKRGIRDKRKLTYKGNLKYYEE